MKLDTTTEAAPVTLAPGMTRTAKRYRPKRAGDLGVYLWWAVGCGVGLGVTVGALSGMVRLGLVVGGIAFLAAFLASAARVVFTDDIDVVEMMETVTRLDLDGDGRIGAPPVVQWTQALQAGETEHRAMVELPVAQVRAWRLFCQRVRDGKCRFSGNAAEEHGVERAAFERVLADWASLDARRALVYASSIGPQKTPRLTPRGEQVVAGYASTPLPQLREALGEWLGQTDSRQSGE